MYLKDKLQHDEAAITAWLQEWIVRGLDAYNAHLERDHLCRQVLARRYADDGGLLPRAAAVRRAALRHRSRRSYPRLALIAENCNALSAFQHAHPSKQPDARQ